jgi:hypothetical protein
VLAAAAVPALVLLWALWRDVLVLEADGLHRRGGGRALVEWAVLSLATAALAASSWAGSRPLRVLGYTLQSLVLSVGFGVAGVLGVMHAFGGPSGDLAAPGWALAGLGAVAALSVASLLATAALLVDDVRAGDAESEAPETRGR